MIYYVVTLSWVWDAWKIIEKDFNHNSTEKMTLAHHDTIPDNPEDEQHDYCTAEARAVRSVSIARRISALTDILSTGIL